jgi:hypothetical protein
MLLLQLIKYHDFEVHYYNPRKWPTWRTILFHACLFLFSICFGQACAPIIRKINGINTTSGMCRSVYMTVWCAGMDDTESHPNLHTKLPSIQSVCLIQTCTPNRHLYRVYVSSKPAHQTAIYTECLSHPNLHIKPSSIQSDIYQISYWYY